jgi:hypothetical protein
MDEDSSKPVEEVVPGENETQLAQESITAVRKIKRAEKYAIDHYGDVIRAVTDKAKEGSLKHAELLAKFVVKERKEEARERAGRRADRPRELPATVRMAIASLPIGGQGRTVAVAEVAMSAGLAPGRVLQRVPEVSESGESKQLAAQVRNKLGAEERPCARCNLPYRPARPHIQRFCSICGEENEREKARERKARFLARHASTL